MKKILQKLSLLISVALLLVVSGAFITRSPATVHALNSAAACDGSTDDTTTINNELSAGADQVILPKGTCIVSGSLSVPTNTWLSGKGTATIVKAGSNPSYPVIKCDNAPSCKVSDLNVNGNATSSGTRTADGIYAMLGSDHADFWNVEVYNTADNGLESNASYVRFHDFYSHDNYTNCAYVIGIDNSGAITRAVGNQIYNFHTKDCSKNSSPANKWDGVDVDPITAYATVHNGYIDGNDLIFYESGVSVSNSYGHRFYDITVVNSTENCINFLGPLSDIGGSGLRCENVTGWGLTINGNTHRFNFSDLDVIGATKECIYVTGSPAPSNGSIHGTHLENCGGTSNTYSGMNFAGGAYDIWVEGNKVLDTRSPMLMKYAIDANSGGNNIKIVNNRTDAGLTGNIRTKAGQTAANNY